MATKIKAKTKKARPIEAINVPLDTEAALGVIQIAALLSVSRSAVERLISEREFPQADFHVLKRLPRWHKATFNQWYREKFRAPKG